MIQKNKVSVGHIRKENAYIQNDLCYADHPILIDFFANGYDIY